MTYENAAEIIYEEYKTLCSKYNIPDTCECMLVSEAEYLYQVFQYKYKQSSSEKLFDMMMYYYFTFLRDRLAASAYYKDDDGNIKYCIYISKNVLARELLDSISKHLSDTTVTEYLKMVVAHEVGHIIHFMSVIEKAGSFEAGAKILRYETTRAEIAYSKYIDKLEPESETMKNEEYAYKIAKNYFSHKSEREANKAVGIDTEKFISLQIAVQTYRSYDANKDYYIFTDDIGRVMDMLPFTNYTMTRTNLSDINFSINMRKFDINKSNESADTTLCDIYDSNIIDQLKLTFHKIDYSKLDLDIDRGICIYYIRKKNNELTYWYIYGNC